MSDMKSYLLGRSSEHIQTDGTQDHSRKAIHPVAEVYLSDLLLKPLDELLRSRCGDDLVFPEC